MTQSQRPRDDSDEQMPEARPRSVRWIYRVSHWSKRLPMIPILLLMALADAFVFWNTLVATFQQDTAWLFVLVVALSIGAVAVCHEIGRLMRERHRGYASGLLWASLLASLWLTLGLGIAWMRSRQNFGAPPQVISELDEPTTEAVSGLASPSYQVALLMLVLYLLTGTLAMGYGYRFNDPRTRAQLALIRDREELVQEKRRIQHARELAELRLALHNENVDLARAFHNGRLNVDAAIEQQLQHSWRKSAAMAQGDPASTDELFPPPRPYPDGHKERDEPRYAPDLDDEVPYRAEGR